MELRISEKYPSICLNMIVKNESHIIKETLEMLFSKINFAYWVICDTGSTDNTCDIIKQFFKTKNIPGELHFCEWKNFAYNRTLALEIAYNKTDLLLVFDADDEIYGDIKIPKIIDADGYYLNFGSETGISYQRILLVNNRIKWIYQSVIHEYIVCLKQNHILKTIEGNYYVVSGRRGNRNKDPNKYLKDAKILEEAYIEAKKIDDKLYLRYGFYCANSYKDAGLSNEAIKWYKITLGNDNWAQEKYMCCYNLYQQYTKIGQRETGFFYLVESFKYDTERYECVYNLIQHYCSNGQNNIAYQYYGLIKDFYETKYLESSTNGKLFVEQDKANFFIPYYMILVADKVKETYSEAKQTISKMFQIAFTKKTPIFENFYIGNLLYNLQFFFELCINDIPNFTQLFQSYIDFLQIKNIYLEQWDFLKKYEKYGIKIHFNKLQTNTVFSIEECKKSNTILFYTGFSNVEWNYTYSITNGLGGSETAVANLSKLFPSNYNIYVAGAVSEEKIDNVTYVNLDSLRKLIKTQPFHTIIVSRYIGFYEMFSNISFYQSFIWGHDTSLLNYGSNLDSNSIIKKWNTKINGCICQTEWHKNIFSEKYPELNNKITLINNGIPVDNFIHKPVKISNRFIYTSCSERGLDRIIELWPQILNISPDAELFISSYNKFPNNDFEKQLQTNIAKYDSIKHLGALNKDKLYELMASAEFWFYPTNWPETSCITAMEMLMSEVICIYYPIAGLVDTLGDYGIKVNRGDEISVFSNITDEKKCEIKKKGKEYALICSWENRAKLWINTLNINTNPKKNWVFYCSQQFEQKMIKQYINNLNVIYTNFNVSLTSDKQYILDLKADKITFVYEIVDQDIQNQLQNTNFSYLNTEPLNIPVRLNSVLNILKNNTNMDYYDYSKSNIHVLKQNNIDTHNFKYLPYICNNEELDVLTKLNNETEKIYDFGLIIGSGERMLVRRKAVVDFLTNSGLTVHIISGWDIQRDKELAKCKYILNIHGFFIVPSAIFEHIRCDRLLQAGINILSEQSLYLDNNFIEKYPHLKIIEYDDFFNYDKINSILNRKKIIDCFIFYNELDLLNYRLNLLNDVVDYFVLVESTKTFVGKNKPLFYDENKKQFSKFNHKIIHIIVDDMPFEQQHININNNEQWKNEMHQRRCINRGLKQLVLNNNDLIIIADIDEFINPQILRQILTSKNNIEVAILQMDFYYYNLNCKRNEKWNWVKICSYEYFLKHSEDCQHIRDTFNCSIYINAGWHLSYFGDVNFIKNKIQNFSHQELNTDYFTNNDSIQDKIENCKDIFERELTSETNNMKYINVNDNNNLPLMYDIYLTNYFTKTVNNCDDNLIITLNNNILDNFELKNHEYLVNNNYYNNKSGINEYRLYSYLTTFFNNTTILDIGTLDGRSAIALSYNNTNEVISYNIVDDIKNSKHKIYSKNNIEFRIKNILDDLTKEFISNCKLIIIDIDHYGFNELKIIDTLNKLKFSGLILLDDIIHPDPVMYECMQKLWNNIQYPKIDLTKYGHESGTGCILMNTNIKIILDNNNL